MTDSFDSEELPPDPIAGRIGKANKSVRRPARPDQKAGSLSRDSHVTVTLSTEYRPEHSMPTENRYIFAYRVAVTNHGSTPVTLTGRSWIIAGGENEPELVDSDDINGANPALAPGESYNYLGLCPLTVSFGTLDGELRYRLAGKECRLKLERSYLAANLANDAASS